MEGLTICCAMPGDGGVAELAGQRRIGEMPGTLLQFVDTDASNHDVVGAERRHLDPGDRVTDLDTCIGGPYGWGNGGGRGGVLDDGGCGRRGGDGRRGRNSGSGGRVGNRHFRGFGDECTEARIEIALGGRRLQPGAPQLIDNETEHGEAGQNKSASE